MKNSERTLRSGHQVFHVEDIRGCKYQKPNWDPICFYPEEERGIVYPHNDLLIVEAHIAKFDIRRILVDTGPYTATITTNFLVVDYPTTYNVIFGCTSINDLKVMVSTHILLMKFPTPYSNGYIREYQLSARLFYNTSVKQQHLHVPKETFYIHDQVMKTNPDEANSALRNGNGQPNDTQDDSFTQQAHPAEELDNVSISKDYPDRMVKIGTTLSPSLRLALISFSQENAKVFAWLYEDMLGISPNIICHRLSIDPKTKPVKQKHRSYDVERYEAIKAEVEKLKDIGFVHEVNYPTWVANVVIVKKNSTKESLLLQKTLWRMCVDYTDLNKRCPKDSFPLPLIDRLIDSTAECELLSFIDVYSGQRGIEANPKKIKAILNMKEPVTSKDIQSLTSKVAALTRLISKATYRSSAVSSVLIRIDGSVERPIYYVSKALQDTETRYSNIEKLALALIMSARKLRPYFQAFSIIVFTNHPLQQVLQSPNTSERMIKWAITLGEFDISYQTKPAEKGQAVADFISEFTYPIDISPTPEALASLPSKAQKVKPTFPVWILYVDGTSNQQGCGAELVLTVPDKVAMEYVLRFKFKASNNEAKYEALLASLHLAKHLGIKQLDIFSDFQLVVNQITNNFVAKDSFMATYLAQAQILLKHFHYQITQVPRVANSHADALARLASVVEDEIGRNIHVELLATPSTMAIEMYNLQQGDSWITPIYKFLAHGTLLDDKVQAKQIRYKFTRYLIINDQLYKRGFTLPCLRCLTPAEGEMVIREIHEGVCGDHAGSRSLAQKANGQVEAINKIIKRTLKTSLDKAKGLWPELVPQVLWSYRTSYRTSTGETPLSLAFGTEAVIPVELEQATYRVKNYRQSENDKQLALNLEFLSEATLSPNWDGPFEVVSISRPGSYKLRSSDGETLDHLWIADHLKYYYK
ncbi:uncharacterized protein [Pyrus communis]|uniref:uncharacterized protein n=1 Tax=Pyrus communis TaxID=23211 RepID=UPI0035BF9FDB